MERFEYKVVPAPRNGIRVKGVKGPAAKFAATLEASMNALATDGWEYIRTESLPADERQGLTRRKTETTQNVMIFRRLTDEKINEEPIIAPIIATRDDEVETIFDETEDGDFPEEEAEAEEDAKS